MRRFRALLWPVAVLVAGLLAGWGAETAVARFQNYALYGFARPVADLLLIIGAVWLVVAVARMALARFRR
ncbi:MAG TPA: hypothetical protein VLJ13_09580, partial [Brevundimonas sp.]|nr:hypothetical protein [Brevundimonas sp.]